MPLESSCNDKCKNILTSDTQKGYEEKTSPCMKYITSPQPCERFIHKKLSLLTSHIKNAYKGH